MTIYVDQMFLENFIMNGIILLATAKVANVKIKWYRIASSSALGAIYVICSYIFSFYDGRFIFLKAILALFMVAIAFDNKSIKHFFELFVIFISITFMIGGISFGIAFFSDAFKIADGGILYVEESPVVIMVLSCAIFIIICRWIFIFLKKRFALKRFLYDVEINVFDRKSIFTALLDSGHNVREKFTGYPVVIVEKWILNELIPDYIFTKIENGNFEFEDKWRKRLCFIPISTVNSENDLLTGVRVDKCIVHTEFYDKVVNNLIVAGCNRKLDEAGKYFALMGDIVSN